MDLRVYNAEGKALRSIQVPETVYGVELNEGLLHLVVKAYLANKRQGTHATKTRSFVSGGGKKPFKQKGTGGARQGSMRGPHMPGGAEAHGPQPRDYRQKMNKKTKSLALKVALSDKVRHGKLFVVDDFKLAGFSTKHMVKTLGSFNAKSALFADKGNLYLYKSARNLPNGAAKLTREINAEDVLRYESLIVSESAIVELSERLKEQVK